MENLMQMNNDELEYHQSPSDFAAIYARRSSAKDSLSIDTQVRLAKEKAIEMNLLIYDIYKEETSATGHFEEKRPELKRLLEDAKANKFKTVIVFKRDRLTRNIEDAVLIKNLFKELDVKVVYTDPGEYVSDGSLMSNFVENFIIGIAELEAEMTRNRVEPGRENKRKRREYSSPKVPFVFTKTKTKPAEFIPKDEKVSELVKKLFEAYINANGTSEETDKIFNEIKDRYAKDLKGYDTCIPFIKSAIIAGLQTKDRKNVLTIHLFLIAKLENTKLILIFIKNAQMLKP